MTPNIRKASKAHDDPSKFMWFDIGQLPKNSPEIALDQERLVRLPFERCALAGLDQDGHLFMLILIADTGKSVAVAGMTMTRSHGAAQIPGFSYISQEDGSIALHRAENIEGCRSAVAVIDWWLEHMENSSWVAYTPEPSENVINRQRIAKGKRPLSYTWRTEIIMPRHAARAARCESEPTGIHLRAHDRRGHGRTYPSGKRGWVRSCRVGDASRGTVFKDYKVDGGSDGNITRTT